jgi:hypothetical protein
MQKLELILKSSVMIVKILILSIMGFGVLEAQDTKPLPRVKNSVPFPEVIKTQTLAEKIVSLRRAIEDIENDHAKGYAGEEFLAELGKLEKMKNTQEREEALSQLQRSALMANPAIDFDDVLLVRRKLGSPKDRTSMGRRIGMPSGNFSSMYDSQRNLPSVPQGCTKGVPRVQTLRL